jgi:Leucine-rich repeat (LRR) protein
MTTADSISAALAQPHQVESLYLGQYEPCLVLPPELAQLPLLRCLEIDSYCRVDLSGLDRLPQLEQLILHQPLTELPLSLLALPNLQRLRMNLQLMSELPAALGQLSGLTDLELTLAAGHKLPTAWLGLAQLRRLVLGSGSSIAYFQIEIAAEWAELQVEELMLWGIELDFRPFRQLRKLEYHSRDLQPDLLRIVQQLPQLVELNVSGRSLYAGIVPHQIDQLSQLERLSFNACGLYMLPATLANLPKLTSLCLYSQRFEKFPLELTQLKQLQVLELVKAGTLSSLPEELAQLSNLRRLSLSGSLAVEPSAALQTPLLHRVACLPQLEDLDLSHCNLCDLNGLSAATGLGSLNLSWNSFADLTPLAHLQQLEQLDLSMCYSVVKLKALLGLPLQRLNLASCYDIKSLKPLLKLKSLRELNIESLTGREALALLKHPSLQQLQANDELMARFARRHEISAVVSAKDIKQALAAEVLEQVIWGLSQLAAWISVHRVAAQEPNPLFDCFGLEPDAAETTVVIKLKLLDRAFSRVAAQLSSAALLELVAATFAEQADNFKITLLIVDELIRRQDEAAQAAFIELLQRACQHYDAGHRYYEDTVYDQLIESYLPQFQPMPLAKLLLALNADYWGADGLGALLGPALVGDLPKSTEQALLNKLSEMIEKYPSSFERWHWIVEQLLPRDLSPNARARVDALHQQQRIWLDMRADLQQSQRVAVHLQQLLDRRNQDCFDWLCWPLADAIRNKAEPFEVLWPELLRALDLGWRHAVFLLAAMFTLDATACRAAILSLATSEVLLGLWCERLYSAREQSRKTSERAAIKCCLAALSPKPPKMPKATKKREPVAENEAYIRKLNQAASTASLAKLLKLLRQATQLTQSIRLTEIVAANVHNKLLALVQADKISSALELLQVYLLLVPHLGRGERVNEALTSMALMACLLADEPQPELEAEFLSWLPGNINLPNLAFNLACYYARRGPVQSLYEIIRQGRVLGKRADEYQRDPDFVAYLNDAEFLAALA